MSKRSEPLEPLISNCSAFLRPEAKRVASIVPTAPFGEVHDGLDRVVDGHGRPSRSLTNVRRRGRHGVDLADQVAREVDHVRAEVAERAGARDVLVEPPDHREVGVDDPLLQVAPAEVEDLAELARLDDLRARAARRARSGS